MGRAKIAVISSLCTKEEIFFHKYDRRYGMLFARKVNIIYLIPTFVRTINRFENGIKKIF
jgi:hypothetical protein